MKQLSKIIVSVVCCSVLSLPVYSSNDLNTVKMSSFYRHKVDSVLNLMTLDEKIGQLNQYTGNYQATGPVVEDTTKIEQIKRG